MEHSLRYRLKKGVVLFSMCGERFLVPSREAGYRAPVILSVSPELAAVLLKEETVLSAVSEETLARLQRLAAAGFLEEY